MSELQTGDLNPGIQAAADQIAAVVRGMDIPTNPYVGPRPFTQAETDQGRFFGRELEAQRITSLIVSHRLTLVYAQSGAGKTSLFNAKIIPTLEREFEYEALPVARVRGVEVRDLTPRNHYAFNALRGFDENPEKLARQTMTEYLAGLPPRQTSEGERANRLLVFDQLEEIFEYYPPGWQAQRQEFFQQVADAIQADPHLRIIFIIREDYLAKLKPYENILPERLETRFRLELLGAAQALDAVRKPLESIRASRTYGPDAAELLVGKLTGVITQDDSGQRIKVEGTHVEPVQLQVVCQTLWDEQEAAGSAEITRAEIEKFNVDNALATFYDKSIAAVRSRHRVNESRLRDFFSQQLITPLETRSTVVKERSQTGGIPNEVVEFLDRERHLLRTISMRGAPWVELTHDSLVKPILDANRRWQERSRSRFILTMGLVAAGIFLVILLSQAFRVNQQVAALDAQVASVTAQATIIFQEAAQAAQAANATQNADVFATATAEVAQAQAAVATATSVAQATGTAVILEGQTATVVALATATEIAVQQAAAAAAEAQARLAVSRQLAAQSSIILNNQRDLALLLAAQSYQASDTLESRQSLLAGLLNERRLTEHAGVVTSLAFRPDGKILATGSDDKPIIILWDVNTGAKLAELEGHTDSVTGLAFSRDGERLISVGLDGLVIRWDARFFAADGGWDAQSYSEDRRVAAEGKIPLLWDVVFHPTEARFATAQQDGLVVVWNAATFEVEAELFSSGFPVYGLAWSPDGTRLAGAGSDRLVHVWEVASGEEILTLRGHAEVIKTVAWSPAGNLLATAGEDGRLILWDAATGRETAPRGLSHGAPVQSLAFSPDGSVLASGGEDRVTRFWDVAAGAPRLPALSVHEHWVMGVAFSPDGQIFASISLDGTAYLNNIAARLGLMRLLNESASEIHEVAFSPDGLYLAAATSDHTVHFWDTLAGASLAVTVNPGAAHTGSLRALAFAASGRLATGSDDGAVITWDWKPAEGGISLTGFSEGSQRGTVLGVAWSPDGALIASGGTRESDLLHLWQPGSGLADLLLTGHLDWVWDVAFSPDGALLASASSDTTVRLWDPANRQPALRLLGHTDFVYDVNFSPDGTRLASGSSDDTIRIWDTASGSPLLTLTGHAGAVSNVIYSPDGRLLVSSSLEGNDIILWDAHTGAYMYRLPFHTDWVRTIALSPDGQTLASAGDDRLIILWNFDPAAWVTLACGIAGRNLTLAEWNQYLPGRPYQQTCAAFPPDPAALATATPAPTPTPSPTP
jgi:WD40 repeat protein